MPESLPLANDLYQLLLVVGIPSTLGALIYIGRKLQILDDMKRSIDRMRTNIKIVSDFLIRHNSEFDPSELQTMSPVQLTNIGIRFLETVGFIPVFKANKSAFFECIDMDKPVLKYDVEAAAIKSIYTLSSKSFMNFLKEFFYNNPTRNLENTAPTLGIYVRDQYLKIHPEITS